jgi:phosphoribosylanthranilate isomerase
MSEHRRGFVAAVGIDTSTTYRELQSRLWTEPRDLGVLAVGLLMSEKTGLQGVRNRHESLYPLPPEAKRIAQARETQIGPSLEIVVHYNTDHPDEIADQLLQALSPIQNAIAGVQVNGLNFEQAKTLQKFKAQHPDISTIMQIHRGLLARYKPAELAALVAGCPDVDYVWLDASGREGIELDLAELMPYIAELAEKTPVGIGIAGGLNADNVYDLLAPAVNEYPWLSWDGQKGIQTYGRFDINKAEQFLAVSTGLRETFPPQ